MAAPALDSRKRWVVQVCLLVFETSVEGTAQQQEQGIPQRLARLSRNETFQHSPSLVYTFGHHRRSNRPGATRVPPPAQPLRNRGVAFSPQAVSRVGVIDPCAKSRKSGINVGVVPFSRPYPHTPWFLDGYGYRQGKSDTPCGAWVDSFLRDTVQLMHTAQIPGGKQDLFLAQKIEISVTRGTFIDDG